MMVMFHGTIDNCIENLYDVLVIMIFQMLILLVTEGL